MSRPFSIRDGAGLAAGAVALGDHADTFRLVCAFSVFNSIWMIRHE